MLIPCPAPSLNSFRQPAQWLLLTARGWCLLETHVPAPCPHTQCNKAKVTDPIGTVTDVWVASVACLNLGVRWLESQSVALHVWSLCASLMKHRDMDQG